MEHRETATFTITATGTAPLSYQWKVDRNDGKGFVEISGATGTEYTTSAVDKTCNGFKYLCVVTNSEGNVESNVAVLTVTEEPKEPEEPTEPEEKTYREIKEYR